MHEHLVKGRFAQRYVGQLNTNLVDPAEYLGKCHNSVRRRHRHGVRLVIRLGVLEIGDRSPDFGQVGRIDRTHRAVAESHAALEFLGGPVGDNTAMINDDDGIAERVGFFKILRREQDGGALRR